MNSSSSDAKQSTEFQARIDAKGVQLPNFPHYYWVKLRLSPELYILDWFNQAQMLYIDARAVPTDMVDLFTSWDRAMDTLPSSSMCQHKSAVKRFLSISMVCFCEKPYMATRLTINNESTRFSHSSKPVLSRVPTNKSKGLALNPPVPSLREGSQVSLPSTTTLTVS